MKTVVRNLTHISPRELDQHLARGWYRMGQGIYTCSLLWGKTGQTPVIWLRLPLHNFRFNKRQRRIMRRNAQRFRVEIRPFEFYEEQEELFKVYKASFDGSLSNSFKLQVNGGNDVNVFDSKEIAIYDGERLVAFSLFDLGWLSATSISGIYHPDYARYSLGYWTMLLEIEYAQSIGKHFYYPGYVAPGISKFDYKLRIGKQVEGYLPVSGLWIPYSRFPHEMLLPNQVIKQLCLLKAELDDLGLQTRLLPRFRQTFTGPRGVLVGSIEHTHAFFHMPWLLVVAHPRKKQHFIVISYQLPGGYCVVQQTFSAKGEIRDWKIADKIVLHPAVAREKTFAHKQGEELPVECFLNFQWMYEYVKAIIS